MRERTTLRPTRARRRTQRKRRRTDGQRGLTKPSQGPVMPCHAMPCHATPCHAGRHACECADYSVFVLLVQITFAKFAVSTRSPIPIPKFLM
jgi:hypothetical protein